MGFFEKFANKVNERVKEDEDNIEFRSFDDVVNEARGVKDEPVSAPAPSPLNVGASAETGNINLKFAKPTSYNNDEVSELAEFLLDGYIVVLDVEGMAKGDIIRFLDFLNGVTYVTEGTITQRNSKTFLITPRNVNISD